MARPKEQELKKRIGQAKNLLINQCPMERAIEQIGKQFNVPKRTATRYLDQARKQLTDEYRARDMDAERQAVAWRLYVMLLEGVAGWDEPIKLKHTKPVLVKKSNGQEVVKMETEERVEFHKVKDRRYVFDVLRFYVEFAGLKAPEISGVHHSHKHSLELHLDTMSDEQLERYAEEHGILPEGAFDLRSIGRISEA